MRPVTALVLDSMHVGDQGSICLPAVEVGTGGVYIANPIQRALYDFWREMCKTEYDYVFLLGEATDGTNRHSEGLGLWTTDTKLQAEVAAKLLSMVKCKEMFMVYGSAYHIKDNPNTEQYVAQLLGLDSKHHGWEKIVEVPMKGHDIPIHLSHMVPVSMGPWSYRATAVGKELLMAELNKAELGPVEGILRGHAHYYVEVGFGKQWGVVCPCWKIRDIFSVTRLGLAGVPRLGYVTLEFRDEWRAPHIEPHILNLKAQGLDMVERVKAKRVVR
jgi:hypothetical protein